MYKSKKNIEVIAINKYKRNLNLAKEPRNKREVRSNDSFAESFAQGTCEIMRT